ncbi:MAG: hypothetical protein WCH43_09660 [Verrucomicrobiota bacterium]
MKTPIILSVALNAILMVLLIHSLNNQSTLSKSERSDSETARPAEPPTPAANEPAVALISWKQLESKDYAVYISNLRKLGCPERTIRNIITQEVSDQYEDKQRKSGDLQAQQNLRNEEAGLLGSLLGPQPIAAETIPHVTIPGTNSPASLNSGLENPTLLTAQTSQKETGVSGAAVAVEPPSRSGGNDRLKNPIQKSAQDFTPPAGGNAQSNTGLRGPALNIPADSMYRIWYGDAAYMALQYQEHLKGMKQ